MSLHYIPLTLREKCPYLEFFWSVFCHIWTEYVSLRIQSKCGKYWPEEFRIQTLFTQCESFKKYYHRHISLTENSHFIFRNIQLKKHIHSFTLSLKTIFWKDCEFPLKYLLLLWLSTYTQEKSLSYHHLVLTYCWFSIGSSLWHTQASPNTSIGMD